MCVCACMCMCAYVRILMGSLVAGRGSGGGPLGVLSTRHGRGISAERKTKSSSLLCGFGPHQKVLRYDRSLELTECDRVAVLVGRGLPDVAAKNTFGGCILRGWNNNNKEVLMYSFLFVPFLWFVSQ